MINDKTFNGCTVNLQIRHKTEPCLGGDECLPCYVSSLEFKNAALLQVAKYAQAFVNNTGDMERDELEKALAALPPEVKL